MSDFPSREGQGGLAQGAGGSGSRAVTGRAGGPVSNQAEMSCRCSWGCEGAVGALTPPPPLSPALYSHPAPPGMPFPLSAVAGRAGARSSAGAGFALEDEQLVLLLAVAVRGSARGCAVGYGAVSPGMGAGGCWLCSAGSRAGCDSPFPLGKPPFCFWVGAAPLFCFWEGAACACTDPAVSPRLPAGHGRPELRGEGGR